MLRSHGEKSEMKYSSLLLALFCPTLLYVLFNLRSQQRTRISRDAESFFPRYAASEGAYRVVDSITILVLVWTPVGPEYREDSVNVQDDRHSFSGTKVNRRQTWKALVRVECGRRKRDDFNNTQSEAEAYLV